MKQTPIQLNFHEKYHLFDITEEDSALIEYIPNRLRGKIESIKLILDKPVRKGNEWTAIVLKFKEELNTNNLIEVAVKIKADEY